MSNQDDALGDPALHIQSGFPTKKRRKTFRRVLLIVLVVIPSLTIAVVVLPVEG